MILWGHRDKGIFMCNTVIIRALSLNLINVFQKQNKTKHTLLYQDVSKEQYEYILKHNSLVNPFRIISFYSLVESHRPKPHERMKSKV